MTFSTTQYITLTTTLFTFYYFIFLSMLHVSTFYNCPFFFLFYSSQQDIIPLSMIVHFSSYHFLWLCIDRLIIMAKFIIIKTMIIASKLAYQSVHELLCFYGLLIDIVSGWNSKFTRGFWTQVFTKLEITLSISSMNHPQSDGHTNE